MGEPPRQRKPVDLGNGLVQASFALDGTWLSFGAIHATVGPVEFVGVPVLAPVEHADAAAVRAHRRRLSEPAWGPLAFPELSAEWRASDGRWVGSGPGWTSVITAGVPDHGRGVVQSHTIRVSGAGSMRVRVRGRLDLPEYAMVTPVGPVPPRLPATAATARGTELVLAVPTFADRPELTISVSGAHADPGLDLGGWRADGVGHLLEIRWDGARPEVRIAISAVFGRDGIDPPPPRSPDPVPGAGSERIAAGARAYTLGCTAVPAAGGTCCILTDHRVLPLSWTRDAYFQAALLLAHGDEIGQDVVRRHLGWLWSIGRDADGVWQRSHLVTGAVKDRAYQADQQLYPVLELVDHREATGSWADPPDDTGSWGELVREVWVSLPRDGVLLPGSENPADDPAGHPLLLSNQILLAYVARRLLPWAGELGLTDLDLAVALPALMDAIEREFTCPGPFGPQWAYDTDGQGRHHLYHDANDVPTALAPLWGVCSADNPRWSATMRFAWSGNNPGYVPGALAGLGSRHTPGVWPLGDAQEWVVASVTRDATREAAARSRLDTVASADGMLPETYDPGSGEWRARPWFAWPGSLVGLLDHTLTRGEGPWAHAGGAG